MKVRPAFELADVFRRHGEGYERANAGHLGRVERRVIGAITACRTAPLGGHVERCDDCGLTRIAYNSCRNRHCGKCQGVARAEWLAARQAELLPVPYFHVVFTLPPAAAEIAFQNKQTVYGLLMRATAQALMTLAAERRGAKIGLIAVLHKWGQTLTHHPHVHCLVPGGGVALDGQRWVACKPNFLLSVRALSKIFRRLFLDGLEAAFRRGELGFFGDLVPLAEVAAFAEWVRALRQSAFVVYAKPPFGGPERVLAYLARYTQPHGDRQLEARRRRRRSCGVLLQELSPRRPKRRHAACPARVHPPLSPPRPARRLPPHPSLRLPRQRRPRPHPRARAQPASRARRRSPAAEFRAGGGALSRTVRRLPGLRRPHAPHGAHRARQIRRLSLRHIMITNADLISIAFDFLARRASSPPAPRFSASFALRPLASASTPSSSLRPSRPDASGRTVKPFCDRSRHSHRPRPGGPQSKAALRFPHSD